MCSSRFINTVSLSLASQRRSVENFLAQNNLRYATMDTYVTVSEDEDGDRILAGGGLEGNLIKCVAVSEAARSEGLTAKLLSRLMEITRERGYETVRLFTKPANRSIFGSLGFRLLASAENAILMEAGADGLKEYKKYLSEKSTEGRNGVIVMNANPFTLGHRYLVEQAAAQVDRLYVIAVKEDRSLFPYEERLKMIEKGCEDINNVTVCKGSDYAISAATFPTYFLKRTDDATLTYMALDLDLFANHIAPALGAKIRFAGSEPEDELTSLYNAQMAEKLPAKGVEFVEIPRIQKDRTIISASKVRKALDVGDFAAAGKMVPPTTKPYLLAQLAENALREELDTTPKPGLVDKNDSGAHRDMDYEKMSRGISALRPYFTELAVSAKEKLDAESVRRIGIAAEKTMLEATHGVNTHKGALFCIGLTVSAAASLLESGEDLSEENLRRNIKRIAEGIPQATDTHGAEVKRSYRVGGALDCALHGYSALFEDWLPFYRSLKGEEFCNHRTLLRIMSTLDDTNILHRTCPQTLQRVKEISKQLCNNFDVSDLRKLNRDFIRENISPGGSADMLSLTILINNIINQ